LLFAVGQPPSQECDACVARHGLRLIASFARARRARALELKKTQIWLVSYELLA